MKKHRCDVNIVNTLIHHFRTYQGRTKPYNVDPFFWNESKDIKSLNRLFKLTEIDDLPFVFQLTVCEVELNGTREELVSARADAAGGGLAKDTVVAEARAARDAAQARRTKAEADLARLRVELVQAGSQLLEAVRQKVELSQQLDQWQVMNIR